MIARLDHYDLSQDALRSFRLALERSPRNSEFEANLLSLALIHAVLDLGSEVQRLADFAERSE